MGAVKHIKMAMLDKGMIIKDLAELYVNTPKILADGTKKERKGSLQPVYNMMARDNLTFDTAEQFAELLGCEIVFRDKETGKIY